MSRWNAFAAVALLAVAALHFASIPQTIWEYDESFFAMAVERYEPLLHHPPPPGYPLYIAFVQIVALFTGDAFRALVATSAIAVLAGMAAFVFAFREMANFRTGVVATVLLYACPAVLISGTLPQSDAGALALLGLAIWACARRNPIWIGIACAAVIGWRLQFSIAVAPMFVAALFLLKTWRERAIAVATFGVACLAWFVPLVIAAGGPVSYWSWLSGQAAYYAAHDADLSRSGHSAALIALRFVAHPWGAKWLSLPLLALALFGVAGARSGRRSTLVPLACGSLVYLAFALATMDPADAVRYAIPSLPFVALLAAIALTRFPALAPLALLYAAGAYWYAAPVLRTRATTPAPPAAAARWIAANVPRDAVVLYDLPLGPHASYLLRGWNTMRIDAGLAKYGGNVSVPMVLYTDGERRTAEGVTFRWPDTDAYRKLTRRHYGAVSVVPLPPSQRFRVIEGVYAPERKRDGTAWRWVGARGVLELPELGATRVKLTFRTPPEYPLDRNRVTVSGAAAASAVSGAAAASAAEGQPAAEGRRPGAAAAPLVLLRNETREIIVPYARRLEIVPDRVFVPAKIPGANNRDARTLSVMLTSVEQLDVPRNGG